MPQEPRRTTQPARPRSRTPVEELIPAEVVAAVKKAAKSTETKTATLAQELDERLDIAGRYGVSRRRLKAYLDPLVSAASRKPKSVDSSGVDDTPADAPNADGPSPPSTDAPPPSSRSRKKARLGGTSARTGTKGKRVADTERETEEEWQAKLRARRERQVSVSSILDAAFGSLGKCNPDLWERRTYLMVVGMVYDRLAASEDEISTADLVALAKVLAEQRRSAARDRTDGRVVGNGDGPADPGAENPVRDGRLPDRFGDIVRQLYGTNLPSRTVRRGETDPPSVASPAPAPFGTTPEGRCAT